MCPNHRPNDFGTCCASVVCKKAAANRQTAIFIVEPRDTFSKLSVFGGNQTVAPSLTVGLLPPFFRNVQILAKRWGGSNAAPCELFTRARGAFTPQNFYPSD